MYRQLTIFLLFIGFTNAGNSQQRWSYEEYLKELAQLQKRFHIPETVSREVSSINSLYDGDNGVSPAINDGGIQKEHIFSEQKTPPTNHSEKELEKELDTKIQPFARVHLPDEDPPFGNFSDANDTEASIFCDDELPKVHSHLPAVSKLMMTLSRESENKLETDVISTTEPTNPTEESRTEEPSVDRKKEQLFHKDLHKEEEIAVEQKDFLEQEPAITSSTPQDELTTRGLMGTTTSRAQSMNDTEVKFQQDNQNEIITSRDDSSVDLDVFNDLQELDFHCPAEYGFFPDTNGNCSVFYSCRKGRAEKRVCADGKLHFNPVTRICDHPALALCELECPQVNGRFPVPGYCDMYLECSIGQGKIAACPPQLHFNAITNLCDKPTKVACEVSCPSYNSLVALPGRCNMYASCESGEATYHICPSGLHFNPLSLKCDRPDKAGCDIQQCLSPDGHFPVLGQCSTYIVCRDNFPKIETCPSGLHFNFLLRTCDVPAKAGCELKCKKSTGFFPFPGVCSYYVKCLGGIPSMEKCPDDLEFNAITMQCDNTKKDHCMPHCPIDNGVFPVTNECDLYLRCSNGQPTVKRCPSSLHFNALFKECDVPERAACQPVCPSSSGLFPLPGKCNMFFRCDNNTATVQTCAYGLHFNPRTLTCDWPASARCEMGCPELDGFYPVQGNCNAYVMCSNGHPALKTCSHDKHFSFETRRCDLPKNAKCSPTCSADDGKFPLPGHCDSYISCDDGKPYQNSCPPGLLFNKHIKMCDLPENVVCPSSL